MVTQNYFVMPATVLEKFRSRGFPEGVTLTADHCSLLFSPQDASAPRGLPAEEHFGVAGLQEGVLRVPGAV